MKRLKKNEISDVKSDYRRKALYKIDFWSIGWLVQILNDANKHLTFQHKSIDLLLFM